MDVEEHLCLVNRTQLCMMVTALFTPLEEDSKPCLHAERTKGTHIIMKQMKRHLYVSNGNVYRWTGITYSNVVRKVEGFHCYA